jgi:hypothetical protein
VLCSFITIIFLALWEGAVAGTQQKVCTVLFVLRGREAHNDHSSHPRRV